MLMDLANPAADELFVTSSSLYLVQGDCTVQPTVHFTDRKALQRVSCVCYQINRHMTRNQLQSGDAQAFFLQNLPQWLVQQTLRTVFVVFSTLLQLRSYIRSDQSYRSNRSDLKTRRADHITPILRKLHWLPVRKRFIFKILLFTYKILNGLAPCYLAELINLRQPIRCLRSNNDHLRLHIPVFRTKTYGGRAFSSCAPALWNSLPLDVRSAPSVDTFKTKLKTFLFNNDL